MSFDLEFKWNNGSYNTVNACNLESSLTQPIAVHWKFAPKNSNPESVWFGVIQKVGKIPNPH